MAVCCARECLKELRRGHEIGSIRRHRAMLILYEQECIHRA